MNESMKRLTGKTILSDDGNKYTIGKISGYGSQGVVYEDETGSQMIKLYYPVDSDVINADKIDRLKFIRDVKMPPNFVVIKDIISEPYVGYVMEKVEDHKPLNTYLIQDKNLSFSEWYNKGLGLRERLFIGYIIAKAFGELEKKNLSYCDISGNNILIKTGKAASVKMIDVDNIYVAGRGAATVLGTPRYIAPEVISRQKNPDVLSDNYSLAVILFELLRVGHPYISDEVLDGTPEDEEAALAGRFDYVNDDNSTNMLPEDVVFTDKLSKLFRKCFIDGKNNRIERPSARDFEFALLEASNKVIKCKNCGAWHYPRKQNKVYEGCPWCDAISKPEARLNFYDCLYEGDDYKKGNLLDGKNGRRLVNTFILREGKNQIKKFYIIKIDDLSMDYKSGDNYLTIAKDDKGYWAYNEFSVEGVCIRKYKTGKYIQLKNKKAELLETGDCIYFELKKGQSTNINVGGKDYSFIRMAVFMEESK